MTPVADQFEIDALIDAYLEGDASPDDVAALDHWLEADPANPAAFTARAELHARLAAVCRAPERTASADRSHDAPYSVPHSAFRAPRYAYALAAALLLAATTVVVYFATLTPDPRPLTPDSAPLATVLDTAGGTLVVGETIAEPGADIAAGDIFLDAGSADFRLTNGVEVRLAGDTRLAVHDPMSATLTRGSATFDCPPAAKGYTVHLPAGARVVDLGTVFTVRIDERRTEVQVVEGRVTIQTPAMVGGPVTLATGITARIDEHAAVTFEAIHVTTFADATSVLTDGRQPGFAAPKDIADAHQADTVDGWTWYTAEATESAPLTVPFAGATATVGEQIVRVSASTLELQARGFFFGWSGRGGAVALRSPAFSDVAAGQARVGWVADNGHLRAYASQDNGTTWTPIALDADFTVAAGSLEVVFVANDGIDSNTLLSSVTVRYPVAAPSDDQTTTPLVRGRPISAPPVDPPSP